MYLSYYNLKHKPFQISTDPEFLWLGEKHMEALSTLRYGVLDNKGFLLLTGDVGTGKTTLVNALLKSLGNNFLVAAIRDPDLKPLDFFQYTAHKFGLKREVSSKGSFLIQFEEFLNNAYEHEKKVLLIIDEAQRINQRLLEEIRLLSNIERGESKLLNIFFVGQIEFNDILLRPVNRPIRQRITINYNIEKLSAEETEQYIKHRLAIAGRNASARSRNSAISKSISIGEQSSPAVPNTALFTDGAIKEIHLFSNGYPRLINIICDRSLLTSYVEESRKVLPRHVQECAKELEIPYFGARQKHERIDLRDANVQNSVLPQNTQKKKPSEPGTIQPITELAIDNGGSSGDSADKLQSEKKAAPHSSSGSNGGKVLKVMGTGAAFLMLLAICYFSFFRDSGLSTWTIAAPEQVTALNWPDKLLDSINFSEIAKKIGMEKSSDIPGDGNSDSAGKLMEKNPPFPDDRKAAVAPASTAANKSIKDINLLGKLIMPFPEEVSLPPPSSLANLDMLMETIPLEDSYKVIITGFANSQEDEKSNRKLSEAKANAVKIYLISRGLEEKYMETQGLGSEFPSSQDAANRQRDAVHRVEVEFRRS